MEGPIPDDPACWFSKVVILLDGVGHELVSFLAVQFHLPPEKHPQEARAAQVGILGCDPLGEVILQFGGGMPEIQQLIRGRSFHQGL